MRTYEQAVAVLETELADVESVFRSLGDEGWRRTALLIPLDENLPPWTIFELAGHLGRPRVATGEGPTVRRTFPMTWPGFVPPPVGLNTPT